MASRLSRASQFVILAIQTLTLLAPSSVSAVIWLPPQNAHPQTVAGDVFPQFAVHDGAPWLIWRGTDPIEFDSEIYYAQWNGRSWVFSGTVNPANQDSELPPRVSSAPDGTVWVLWKAQNPDQPDRYLGLTSRWARKGWSLPDTLWRYGARYEGIELVAVSEEEAWFVREGGSSQGTTDIFVYHRTEEGLDPVFQFVQPDADDVIPAVTVDGNGNPWAVWYRLDYGNPDRSPLQFSRRVGSVWSKPQEIPAPRGPVAPKMTSDSGGSPIIVTLAQDPETSIFATAIWALRWQGDSWGVPIRISRPVAAPDSFVFELSVSAQPKVDPQVVWGLKSGPSGTRADLFTSHWSGLSWTFPEFVGELKDSTFVTSPAIASIGEVIWVAYNKWVEGPPSVQNIFALHTLDLSDFVKFSATRARKGILLRWYERLDQDVASIRIRRESDASPSSIIAEFRPNPERAGSFLDTTLAGQGEYSYWLDLTLGSGQGGSVGPRVVHFQAFREGTGISNVVCAPGGTVRITGSADDSSDQVLIFNVAGRLVRALGLASSSAPRRGVFEVQWDGRITGGANAPSGIYFATMRSSAAHRFVLMR